MNISVVIPLFNKEKTIQRAVRSVLAQTYPNFELIVINDGSTDNSFEEASSIENPRIRIICQENQGVSAARNRGIAEARHEWIAFLDADDTWKPDFLLNIKSLTDQYPGSVLYGTSFEIVNCENDLCWINKDLYPEGWSGILVNYIQTMSKTYLFNSSSSVFSKLTLEEIGGFPLGVKNGEDVVTWLRCALIGKICYLHMPLSKYHRDVENSSSRGFDRTQEPYPVIFMKDLLKKRRIAAKDEPFAYDFVAKFSLITAKARIDAGKPFMAIGPLWDCRKSRLYSRKALRFILTRLLQNARNLMKNLNLKFRTNGFPSK